MIILKALRSINEWVKVFTFKPVRIYRTEMVNGVKMEFSEIAMFCRVERRIKYTSGIRQGVEYRWPEKQTAVEKQTNI